MKSFVVIGLGRFGTSVAKTLYNLGNEVMAVDLDPDVVQEISEYVTHAVVADALDETVLHELGLSNFDVVIISIASNIEASIMATLTAKEMGAKKVVVKAQSDVHGKVLTKVGADRIVFPERDMGARVAHNLTSSNILDFIELSPEYYIIEITALERWINKSLSELRLRNKYGVNVLAIKRGSSLKISPVADEIVLEGDILVVIGDEKDIRKIESQAGD
ncbi:MAG: TrkA family potassium uptake protein [Tissierellia bacterium]|jgi:trk system potassium uptake protein TrkA|nr:TrkA family potassium uptake protein [Tissierellia bacterium]